MMDYIKKSRASVYEVLSRDTERKFIAIRKESIFVVIDEYGSVVTDFETIEYVKNLVNMASS